MSNILHGIATFLVHLITFIIGFGAGILCAVMII
jgi:hypothetical protein